MYVNIINSCRDVVAICDEELLGKKFEQENLQLDVKESFYKGEKKSPEEVKKIMKAMKLEEATFNFVGEKTIKIAIETGLITQKNVNTIADIPFSMILL